MPTALELKERRANLASRMHEIVDGAEARDEDLTQEEQNNLESIETEFRSLDARIERQERLERTPAAPAAPVTIQTEGRNQQVSQDQYGEALDDWFRHGTEASIEHRELIRPSRDAAEGRGYGVATNLRAGMSTIESRALQAMNFSAGGATVPTDTSFAARLEAAMLWYGGMREKSTVITTSTGGDLPYPTATDTANSGVVLEEGGAFGTTTDPTFAAVVFKAYKYSSGIVLVPWELLQDSAIDIAAFLAEQLGTRIGRVQNNHFTVGAGASSPTGLMRSTVQGRAGATGTSTSVTWDDLILLEHAVNKAYRNGPGDGFMFHDQTLRDIRRIKDGNGQYLWQPGVANGAPNTINGHAYVINNDMATMAASANSIAYGDLSKYFIRQVRDVQIIRLDELYAGNGRVGFLAWSRADGHLIDAGGNPVQHFTNSAS